MSIDVSFKDHPKDCLKMLTQLKTNERNILKAFHFQAPMDGSLVAEWNFWQTFTHGKKEKCEISTNSRPFLFLNI